VRLSFWGRMVREGENRDDTDTTDKKRGEDLIYICLFALWLAQMPCLIIFDRYNHLDICFYLEFFCCFCAVDRWSKDREGILPTLLLSWLLSGEKACTLKTR